MNEPIIPGKPKETLPTNPVTTPAPEYNKVLIVNQDRRKQRMSIKMRKKIARGFSPNEYFKVLNPKDYNDVAILLEDLDLIIGAPVEKAYRKYKENKGGGFPFF